MVQQCNPSKESSEPMALGGLVAAVAAWTVVKTSLDQEAFIHFTNITASIQKSPAFLWQNGKAISSIQIWVKTSAVGVGGSIEEC